MDRRSFASARAFRAVSIQRPLQPGLPVFGFSSRISAACLRAALLAGRPVRVLAISSKRWVDLPFVMRVNHLSCLAGISWMQAAAAPSATAGGVPVTTR